MFKKSNEKKLDEFLSDLENCITNYNQNDTSNREFTISSSVINNNNLTTRYQLKIEIDFTLDNLYYFYSLNKVIPLPYNIDVSDITIEKIEYDFDNLRQVLNSNNLSYKLLNSSKGQGMFTHQTISAKKGASTVLEGLENDYIYPIITQSNSNSEKYTELNQIIKKNEIKTQFLGIEKN